ncbi:hypothetical protein CEXT_114831 [Caerostris extrusa]|uniref:Uncharacterized protein n=1 Tax=Caerostris extrusa TaxID=172846 RepID=A0AAV4SK93_CAEEX|nr:hypothetical protein CEXT_114831 [Caerostris extrusa]
MARKTMSQGEALLRRLKNGWNGHENTKNFSVEEIGKGFPSQIECILHIMTDKSMCVKLHQTKSMNRVESPYCILAFLAQFEENLNCLLTIGVPLKFIIDHTMIDVACLTVGTIQSGWYSNPGILQTLTYPS